MIEFLNRKHIFAVQYFFKMVTYNYIRKLIIKCLKY
jgi:hypothetical protein